MVWEERRQEMMSQVLYWREARLCQPRKRKRKKKTCLLHLVIAHHALSACTSIFWSNQPDLMVTPNVNFFDLSSETKVKP